MAGAVQLAGHQPMDRPDWTNDRRFTAVADRSSAFSAPSTIRRSVSGLAHGPQIAKDRNDRWNASCTKDRPVVVFVLSLDSRLSKREIEEKTSSLDSTTLDGFRFADDVAGPSDPRPRQRLGQRSGGDDLCLFRNKKAKEKAKERAKIDGTRL